MSDIIKRQCWIEYIIYRIYLGEKYPSKSYDKLWKKYSQYFPITENLNITNSHFYTSNMRKYLNLFNNSSRKITILRDLFAAKLLLFSVDLFDGSFTLLKKYYFCCCIYLEAFCFYNFSLSTIGLKLLLTGMPTVSLQSVTCTIFINGEAINCKTVINLSFQSNLTPR